jgi:hypothetical protein
MKRIPEMVEALRSEYRKTSMYARYWGGEKKKAAAPRKTPKRTRS